ncbi:inositol monophosphatase family protein [Paenibacillus sacheonensis]|uniref:Inositol monophosphatase n=1 Tax=Paenibacillus sacheonensis TaxID=742054 RepID=A0A7X4YU42_9BACL|nr:inositol monophosphatase [Paenibacillus sacheonensis]MBM7568835.1 myo-inositol-1(or 4)-monophosphatase [Paenibacillus sacheonensis]NBC72538.1 inositol monophosphatase [Paenibacillus sacheonensis]
MDTRIIQQAKELSERIIRQAGAIARERFDQIGQLEAKGDFGDIVTEVDHLAEAHLLRHIRPAFPDHQIHSEEAGSLGNESDWLWLIDPLDGTNNYAIGLPVFTVSITLMYKREAVLGVIYEPMTDRLFVSAIGEGAFCNGKPMAMRSSPHLLKGNVGWIQGHAVRNDERAVRLRQFIDLRFKRMMRLWAPTLQWCMLAKGDIDGIILYNSEGDDLYSGLLMVREAGGVVIDFEGNPFTGMREEPYIIACHPEHREQLLRIVREGLG